MWQDTAMHMHEHIFHTYEHDMMFIHTQAPKYTVLAGINILLNFTVIHAKLFAIFHGSCKEKQFHIET